MLSSGDITILFTRPTSAVLLALASGLLCISMVHRVGFWRMKAAGNVNEDS
jgi:hypothetical protein